MESLANIFITTVAFVHAVAPAAGVPQVLGVNEAGTPTREITNSQTPELKKEREMVRMELQEKRQIMLEKKSEAREEFRSRVRTMGSDRKQMALINVADNFSALNTRWISKFNTVADRLGGILDKITARAEMLSASGVDTTELDQKLATARASLESAQALIAEQADKEYLPEMQSEVNVGREVVEMISQFRDDWNQVREHLLDAKDQLHEALALLRTLDSEVTDETDE